MYQIHKMKLIFQDIGNDFGNDNHHNDEDDEDDKEEEDCEESERRDE